jgi:hypothetical protein
MSIPAAILDGAAIARARRGLGLLDAVLDLGMKMVRRLAPAPGAPRDQIVRTTPLFVAISRAVRLTILLQRRVEKALADLRAGIVPEVRAAQSHAVGRLDALASDLDPEDADAIDPEDADRPKSLDPEPLDAAWAHKNRSVTAQVRMERDTWRGDLRRAVERAWRALGVEINWSCWDDEPQSGADSTPESLEGAVRAPEDDGIKAPFPARRREPPPPPRQLVHALE